jgi:hypothetical protein
LDEDVEYFFREPEEKASGILRHQFGCLKISTLL